MDQLWTLEVLPFSRLRYGLPDASIGAIGYAKFYSRLHDAVIRLYDKIGEFKEWSIASCRLSKSS
jgi:hypothetical protein